FSGATPFSNVDCENEEESKILAIDICNGKRPEIQDLPPLIAELIKPCWDADPAKRPSAKDLCKILNKYSEILYFYLANSKNFV
ncbi:680_t:CDS:2, partial [Acaulospora morrowiae]